jgi:rhamnosyltransferase
MSTAPADPQVSDRGAPHRQVNVVLSTFNGETFLAEQLDSILGQTYADWRLLVRDDGSTDGTVDLLRSYAAKDERIRFLNDGAPPENLGFVGSFFTLVKSEPADFVVFCDQDDVWLPTKLEILLAEAEKHDNGVPALYYTRWQAVDEQGRPIPVIGDRQDLFATTRLREQLTTNSVLGATSMINGRLADAWQGYEGLRSHDVFLGLAAAALGELVYVRETTTLYRQHGRNQYGVDHQSASGRSLRSRTEQFWTYYLEQKKREARLVLGVSGVAIPRDRRELIEDFVLMNTYPLVKRVRLVLRHRFYQRSALATLKLWALLASNYGNPMGRAAAPPASA